MGQGVVLEVNLDIYDFIYYLFIMLSQEENR